MFKVNSNHIYNIVLNAKISTKYEIHYLRFQSIVSSPVLLGATYVVMRVFRFTALLTPYHKFISHEITT